MKQAVLKDMRYYGFLLIVILNAGPGSCRRHFSERRQTESQPTKERVSPRLACWKYENKNASWTGPFEIHDRITEERNKEMVKEFYQIVWGDKNVDAIDEYISETNFIQHNPYFPDGREALKAACRKMFKDTPKENIDIQRISADGDLVWTHIKTTDEGKLTSVMDIFKIGPDGKIVEHWDVWQAVPEKSENPHPMF